jgi:hypothetical protein
MHMLTAHIAMVDVCIQAFMQPRLPQLVAAMHHVPHSSANVLLNFHVPALPKQKPCYLLISHVMFDHAVPGAAWLLPESNRS